MAIRADFGIDPLYFSGDEVTLELTIDDGDNPGSPLDLTGVTGITWVLARAQGKTPILTKTLGVGITSPLDTTGRLDVKVSGGDTATFKGSLYHECQIDNGPQTALFGKFVIQADSAPP